MSDIALKDLCLLIVDSEHKTAPKDPDGLHPLVRTTDLGRAQADLTRAQRVSAEVHSQWTRRAVPMVDDLILAREAPVGGIFRIPDGVEPVLGQRTVLLRPDPRVVDSRFLMYRLAGDDLQARMTEMSTGSTVPHLNMADIRAFPIPGLPPLPTQRLIAAVLSAFDTLTEINERRIDLLEDLARSLYREWFVHFRSPGRINEELVESDAGPIPKNWSRKHLAEFVEVVADGVEPSEFGVSDKYVGLEHISRRTTTLQRWGSTETVRSRKLRFARGDTLFGKIRPNLHKVAWAAFPGLASSDTVILRPRDGLTGFVNTLASSDRFVAEAVATANGTKMPRADPKAMLAYEVVVPDEPSPLLIQFNEPVERWLSWSAELVQVNRALTAARDLLLPRLVTGQLDISDVDLGVLTPPDPE